MCIQLIETLFFIFYTVTQFNRTLYPDGVRIYKQLSDKSAPRVETGADTDGVPFGIAAAYDNGALSYSWTVNTRNSRISGNGAVVSVIPSFTATDTDPTLDVEVTLNPVGVSSTAVLTLLGQHTRTHIHTHQQQQHLSPPLHRSSKHYSFSI